MGLATIVGSNRKVTKGAGCPKELLGLHTVVLQPSQAKMDVAVTGQPQCIDRS